MLKQISIFIFVFFTTQAHSEIEDINLVELGEKAESGNIDPGAYKLENPKEININGESFVSYDLSLLGQQNFDSSQSFTINCFNEKAAPLNLNLEKSMFAANFAATALAGYGVYKSKNDKLQHVFAGFLISTTVSGAMQMILPKEMKHRKLVSSLIGFGAAVLIGTGKELRDKQGYGHASVADALATYAGGAMGSVSISFTDLGNLFKKR